MELSRFARVAATGPNIASEMSLFQQEDVVKLVQIIHSEPVDQAYKKSALDQLAILLQGIYKSRAAKSPTCLKTPREAEPKLI